MTVTILVPIYNVERYIAECAESLFSQTYQDIEYVFCNDCTPDNSVSVLQGVLNRFPERKGRTRIISTQRNSGIGTVRKLLTENVRSEAFFFADSDDILPKDAIERLVRKMEECNCDIVDGAHADYCNGTVGAAQLTYHGSDRSFQHRILCQNVEANRVWGRLYKAEVLRKLPDMFHDGIDYSEDYCAVARLAAVTSRAWIDNVVYLYRKDNPASYTKNVSEKNMLSYLRANAKVLEFYKQRGRLPLSLEVGILNTYRECRRNGISIVTADSIVNYIPERLCTKWIYHALRSNNYYNIGDRLYRLLRLVASR